MNIYAFLTFNGNCRQAMTFYQKCLGGKLTFQTLSKTPGAHLLSRQSGKYIVQATLRKDNLVLLGTDMVGDEGLLKGNSVNMLLHCKTKQRAQVIYKRLAQRGRVTQPLKANHFGVMMGGVTDQFGYHWVLTVPI